jgi:molybdopterin-guanine dinucleotide biosynthesis protein A
MDLWVLSHPDVRRAARVRAFTAFIADIILADRELFEGRDAALKETGRELCVARSAEGVHPVIGLWPLAIAEDLEAALDRGLRKTGAFAEQQGAVEVFFPPAELEGRAIDPFFNVNRPEDLALANALLGQQAKTSRVDAADL